MEELLYELEILFPLNPDSPIKKYLHHHEIHLSKCIKNQLYSSGFYHLHLIYMTLIYIQIERILNNVSAQDRRLALIGFAKDENKLYIKENKKQIDRIISASHLSLLNERDVFQFFRIITGNDKIIEEMSNLVYYRNKIFHVQPSVELLEDKESFIKKLEKYINSLKKIIDEELVFLEKLYKQVLSLFKDSIVTEDDLFNEFGSFSTHELRILAKRNKDIVSNQILNIIYTE